MNVQVKNTKSCVTIDAADVLRDLNAADSGYKVKKVIEAVYSQDCTDSDSAFACPVSLDWKLFYRIVERENEFHLDHDAAAYYCTNLVETKLKHMWACRSQKVNQIWAEYEDFRTAVFMMIKAQLNPEVNKKGKVVGWDKSVNDNFLAYLIPQIMTVLNEVTKGEISKYMREKNGITICSLDEKTDNEDNPLQVSGNNPHVEELVEDKMELESNRHIYDVPGKNGGNLTRSITDMLTLTKMFGGVSKQDLELAEKYEQRSSEMQAFAEDFEKIAYEEDAREAV